MNNKLLVEGILLGMSSFGVEIEKLGEDVMYISVPNDSTDYGPDRETPLAGKKLADRLQTKLRDLGCENLKIKYKIRDEVWTKEKRDKIISRN